VIRAGTCILCKFRIINESSSVAFDNFSLQIYSSCAALGGLVVGVPATGPSVAGSGPVEYGGFLSVIKKSVAHFLQRGSKAVGPTS
jgi:hypothetical protein